MFFNGLKNYEKSQIYEEFLKKQPPYIPNWCREKNYGEHTVDDEEWDEIKKDREVQNVRHAIRKMTAMVKTHQKKINEADKKIWDTFSHLAEPLTTKTENKCGVD